MLILVLRRLYVADLAATAFLVVLRIADVKYLGGTFFYPDAHANEWTRMLWAAMTLAIAPWAIVIFVLGLIETLRRTVGIPSEMAASQPPATGREIRKVLPFRRKVS